MNTAGRMAARLTNDGPVGAAEVGAAEVGAPVVGCAVPLPAPLPLPFVGLAVALPFVPLLAGHFWQTKGYLSYGSGLHVKPSDEQLSPVRLPWQFLSLGIMTLQPAAQPNRCAVSGRMNECNTDACSELASAQNADECQVQ